MKLKKVFIVFNAPNYKQCYNKKIAFENYILLFYFCVVLFFHSEFVIVKKIAPAITNSTLKISF